MKTRSFLVLCIILIVHISVMSQVKIGDNATTINSASLLELETTDKGFVLPRVSITDVSSSSPLAAGLLSGTVVYNTNGSTTGGSGIGIYYWDGSKWNFIANTSVTGNYWSLTGNSGTNASTNFIGTTDAKDFVIRTNNVERMHILGATVGSSQAGWIGMGIATTPKSALDVAGNYSGKNVVTIQNTSTTGFSSVDMLDNAGNLATTFGFANSGTGAAFSGKAYLNGYGNDFLFTRGSSYDLIMKGSNGYVGLNTSTPSERLHVVGNFYLTGAFMPGGSAGTSGYILTSAGANAAPVWNNLNGLSWGLTGNSGTNASANFIGTTDAIDFVARTGNTERLRITSTGNIGIGLTNPSYKLAVLSASNPLYLSGVQATGTFTADSILTINGGIVKKSPYSSLLNLGWGLTGNSGTNYSNNFIGTTDNISMRFKTNNVQRMIIDSVGKVGIGLNNPAYALSVLSASNPLYLSGVQATSTFSADSILTINSGIVKKTPYSSLNTNWSLTGNSGTNSSVNFLGTTDNASLRFKTNNTERIYIDSSTGYLGVGTSSPAARLHIREDVSNPGIILDRVSNNNFASTMMLRKARSLSPAIAVTTGDVLGNYVAAGFNGSDFSGPNSGMTIRATQPWTSTANGSEILFRNIANDATGFSYHLGIYQNGRVGIADDAGTSVAYAKLHVNASGGTASGMTAMNGDGIALTGNHFYFENPASASGQRVFSFANSGGVLTINANTNDASATAPSTSLPGAIALKASNGYVGINTNNPSNQLHVLSTADPLRLEGLQAGTSADSILTINSGGIVKYRLLSDIGNGNFWNLTGNSGTSYATSFLGTTDNVSMRFRSNNVERMIIDSTGSVGIGSSAFNAANKEKLLVDYGTTTSNTLANLKGNIDSYFQINLKNRSSGANSSSDYVATSNDGTDSTYYVDLGINGGNYIATEDNWGGPHDAYLYTYGRNLVIGSQTANGDVLFLLGGGRSKYNAVLRLDGANGNLIVGKGENQSNATGNIIRGPNGGNGINIPGGSLTLQGGSSNGNTSGGNLNLYGGGTVSGTMGSVNINTSVNSTTNINTGTSTANVTIGNSNNNILLPKFNTDGGMFYTTATTGQIASTGSNMTWDDVNSRLGIGIASPGYKLSVLSSSDPLYLSGVQATSTFSSDSILTINAGVVKKTPYSSLPSGSGSGWSLTGNIGTNTTTNFLGTTDNTGLIFKVNNIQAGYIANSFSMATSFGYSSSGTSTGQYGTAIGANAQATVQYASAFGYSSTASGQYSTALGYNASASYQYASAFGTGSSAGNQYATALGYNASASSQSSVALGYNSVAGNQDAIAAGNNSNASSAQSVAIGRQATASGYQGIALGYNSSATTGSTTLAIGVSSSATGYQAAALGYSTVASNSQAIAVGNNASASGSQSTAIGNNTSATGTNSTAIGNGATTSQNNALILGNTSANVGIGTSTPNTGTALDVSGSFKLGSNGTVTKNSISFSSILSATNVDYQYGTSTVNGVANVVIKNTNVNYTDVTFTLPNAATNTKASVSVSPAADLPDDIVIAFARLVNTTTAKVRFMNMGTQARSVSGTFYITVTDF